VDVGKGFGVETEHTQDLRLLLNEYPGMYLVFFCSQYHSPWTIISLK
jgi:hypothetical protein